MMRQASIYKWLVFVLAASAAVPAMAQLAPSGQHYAGRPSDTGYGGTFVDAAGGFPAAVSLNLPPARGGIPIPLQIAYGAHAGVGAAGLGWDLPLSYVEQSSTLAHRRPLSGAEALPSLHQRTTLSLLGQSVDLLPQGNVWVARIGTLELTVRESADEWFAYDGEGRTYTFVHAATLPHQGLWLLKSITAAGGAKAELTYQIVTWPLDGGSGTSIDLIDIAYNFRAATPSTLGCAKNEIALSYQNASITPVAMSLLDNRVLVRKNTLTQIDVSGRADCVSQPQRLRRYQFQYQADADTGLPRLSSVAMLGRQGTPEETVPIPVGRYTYGSATDQGSLHYKRTQIIQLPSGVDDSQISGTDRDFSASVPESGQSYSMWQFLTDFTGDGRADLVFKKNNQLWIAKGAAGAAGATTLGEAAQALVPLSDATLTAGSVSLQSSVQSRFQYAAANRNTTDVWRQAIDINGDGRIDIIDAAEEADHWVIYLNTPGGPSGIKWERRSFSVKSLRELLVSSGHTIDGDHVPLSRRATGGNLQVWQCWRWQNNQWNWYAEGFTNHLCEGTAGQILQRGAERTFVEWELADLNGDGYPDFVFDSSPVDFQMVPPAANLQPAGDIRGGQIWQQFAPKTTNQVRVAFNTVGVRFDTSTDAFSRSIDLQVIAAEQGISQWLCEGAGPDAPCDQSAQAEVVGLEDVNGDGLADRVVGTKAYLGLYAGSPDYFSSLYMTLPGPLATQLNDQDQQCKSGGALKPTENQIQGLRDLTGDGIPDYYDNGHVWIGTGTGFQAPIGIVSEGANFRFSHQTDTCDGTRSNTDGGLYDIDGDGRPEVIGLNGNTLIISQLTAAGVDGAPDAGRLIGLDNGYGAKTSVSYVSAKAFTDNPVPFPEIVVGSIAVVGSQHLGGALTGSRYAYGNAAFVFDSALDRFVFRGYGRQVQIDLLDQQESGGSRPVKGPLLGVGSATITDLWPLTSFSLTLTKQQRWQRLQRVGKLRDVSTLRGVVSPDPWALLTVEPNDPRINGATHYEWDARLFELPASPTEDLMGCMDMVDPLDYATSFEDNLGSAGIDACRSHGFAFSTSTSSWYGDAAPPAESNIQTRSRNLQVDDFGRVVSAAYDGDLFRSDDDLCVENIYAASNGSFSRVLSALASRRLTNCDKGVTYAFDTWAYDGLAAGAVSDGRVSSHSYELHTTDDGAFLRRVHAFDAIYDSSGNLRSVRTQRNAAVRAARFSYDLFGIVPTQVERMASGLPTTSTTVSYDPISLQPLSSTDANSTTRGTDYDGYGRPVRSTVTPPGGSLGVIATASYAGDNGTDADGRRMTVKTFPDPQSLGAADSASGRSVTTFYDELGRRRRTEYALGNDYSNETLVAGFRQYDGMGRVAFDADPYSKTQQDPSTAYGSSYHYTNAGDLECIIRGQGMQALNHLTDAASERYPKCFERQFINHEYILDAQDAASLDPGTPQAGVVRRVVSTAIGRAVERSTWRAGLRLEDADFSYDRLGAATSISRFLDPTGNNPVQWSWRLDSLGQVQQLDEPGTATRFYTYSDWREPLQTRWMDGAVDRRLLHQYDALGRVVASSERNGSVVDPTTAVRYTYDTAVSWTPLLAPTAVLGRLAHATTADGEVALSYDALGYVNARIFRNSSGATYVEKEAYHVDGSLAQLGFELPDLGMAAERATYDYDSAGRLRTVTYTDPEGTRPLYQVHAIDVLGRVREALYGDSSVYRTEYAPQGRGLLKAAAVETSLGSRAISFTGYDPIGRELSRRELTNGPSDDRKTDVAYDALGRLSIAVQSSGTIPDFHWNFDYDPLGNIVALQDVLGTSGASLSYDSADRDRLCRLGYGSAGLNGTACNVVQDAVGNVISQPTRDGIRRLSYFDSGNVREINQPGMSAQFAYDAFGQPALVQVHSAESGVQVQQRYGQFLENLSSPGSSPLLIRNIPGPGGIVASRRGSGASWVFTFGELRGNRFFTDQSGNFVQTVDYRPYGEAASSGAAVTEPNYTSSQWNGGNTLASFNLSQLGARIYDPVIGRFLSSDPLLTLRGATSSNPYAFAMNDPVNGADPSGLDCDISATCPGDEGSDPASLLVTALAAGAQWLFGSPAGAPAQTPAPPIDKDPYLVQLGNEAQQSVDAVLNSNRVGSDLQPFYPEGVSALGDLWDQEVPNKDMYQNCGATSACGDAMVQSMWMAHMQSNQAEVDHYLSLDVGEEGIDEEEVENELAPAPLRSTQNGTRWSANLTRSGNAFGYQSPTDGQEVFADLKALVARGFTEIHVGTGVHTSPAPGGWSVTDEPAFFGEDAKSTGIIMSRNPGVSIRLYDIADPAQWARFVGEQGAAQSNPWPGVCTMAATCTSRVLFGTNPP